MATKRTPTGKYREARGLLRTIPPAYRLLWDVIWCECDYAGIWEVDFDFARIAVGMPVTESEALKHFEKHIQVFEDGAKWYLTGYVKEQIGDAGISEKNPVHQNIIKRLRRFALDPFPERKPAAAEPPPVWHNPVFVSKNDDENEPPPERARSVDGPYINTNNKVINKDITVFKKDKRVADKLSVFEEIFSDEIFLQNLAMTHRDKDLKQAWEECYVHHSNALRPPDSLGEWKQKLNSWLTNVKPNAKSKPNSDILRQKLAARIAKG